MKRNHVLIITATIILASLIGACTRSASGGASDLPAGDELPNPVSTQSELMKEIIAGTQTAMAKPITDKEAEEAPEGEEVEAGEAPETDATPKPKATKTPQPLPTSTQGPPPVVELAYNATTCKPGLFICVVGNEKDQTVDVQASYPWLQNKMELTFKMGPEGNYDFSKYIVAGTAMYEPDASKGYGFRTTLNIPDALRGMESIVVRLETNNPNYYGSDFFSNK